MGSGMGSGMSGIYRYRTGIATYHYRPCPLYKRTAALFLKYPDYDYLISKR